MQRNMEKNNKILEAIQRGIKLALDDYEEDILNEPISSKSNVIKNDEYVHKKLRFNELISKFEKQLDSEHDIFFSKNNLNELSQLSKELGLKYKPDSNNTKRTLSHIIYTVCRSDIKANLNWIDTSKETSFFNLFSNTHFIGDISEWNTSNVKTMYGCFALSEFNGDISKWDLSNVYDMSWMFQDSLFNNDSIVKWDVSNVSMMFGTFKDSKFNKDISNWNVSNVKNFSQIFENCPIERKNVPNDFKQIYDYENEQKTII